jgi:hypothetical protein
MVALLISNPKSSKNHRSSSSTAAIRRVGCEGRVPLLPPPPPLLLLLPPLLPLRPSSPTSA